ncbi:ClpXP protease specificity-enhancing factor [Paucibacter aquatile]|uniref:ClpXP protease specificity-enhancing factor n=1 Tax=Kinneretia aquatilis TaxID=2070761 RepID=A0A2N8L391_9BURK|nr:ClpXP protease specificity-enhancing factor [Paucibacter aquatile]PND40168.1 ClpXP protease specificity-enhancing factor [Paucibacter aquatile]
MDQSPDKGGPGSSSTRPYLIRALHDWCTDNGFTPYIAVHVDRLVQVPMEYVSNNEIVLNVGFDATSGLDLGNEFIQFKARFGGTAREIMVPVDHVVAIYARENGQGMAFPAPELADTTAPAAGAVAASPSVAEAPKPARGLRLASVPSAAPEATDESPATESPLESPAAAPEPAAAAPALTSVPASPAPAADAAPGDGSEPDGPGPGAGRPALKRIK